MKIPILCVSFLLSSVTLLHSFFYDGATYAAQKGDWKQAHEKFNKLLVDNPDNADIAYDAGVVAYNLQHFSHAQAYFLRAAEQTLSPEFACRAYYNAGNACVELKDLKTALEHYDKALAKDPSDEYVKHNRDKVAEMLKQQEQQNRQEQQKQQEEQQEKKQQEEQQEKNNDQQDQNQDDADGDEQSSDNQNGQQQKKQKQQKRRGSSEKNRDEQSQDDEREDTEQGDADQKGKNSRNKKNQQKKANNNKERDGHNESKNESRNAEDERNKQQGEKHNGSPENNNKQSDDTSVASENKQAQAKNGEEQQGVAEQQTEAGMHGELEKKLQDQWLVSVLDKQEDRDKAMNKRLIESKIRQHGGNNGRNAW
jgi:Ca-activated chloride channel homolog